MEFDATKRTEDEAVCDHRHLANQISAARNSNPVRNSLPTTMRYYSNVADSAHAGGTTVPLTGLKYFHFSVVKVIMAISISVTIYK